jgi:hypothetical protein
MPEEIHLRIETYLKRVRARLRGLNEENSRDIVEELRSHILDKLATRGEATIAAVDAAILSLGSPEELAGQYLTSESLARAEVSRSPLRILEGLFRWASISISGFFVLAGSAAGYLLGVIFLLLAVLKPLHPESAGLWVSHDNTGDLAISLRLGLSSAPGIGKDVLGWWVIPIGILAGCGFSILTTRFAVWCARQYRKNHALRSV